MVNQWITAAELAKEHHPDCDGWDRVVIKHAQEVLCDLNGPCVLSIMAFANESGA
jgi:hypothetical protein